MVESVVIGIVIAYLLIKFTKIAIQIAMVGALLYGLLILSQF